MQYTVQRAPSPLGTPNADWHRPQWETAETLEVTHFSWEDSGHHPRTCARLAYDDDFLGIIFQVEDKYVRAVAENFQDSVCSDSCVEFFVAPLPDSDAYFNFEVNCGGTMLVRRCTTEEESQAGVEAVAVTAADFATIALATSLPKIVEPEITEPTTWTLEYHLPFALFTTYFDIAPPTSGTAWKGNFYKCGDQTSHPHWGSWAPVGTPKPSFHQPSSYQPILFA